MYVCVCVCVYVDKNIIHICIYRWGFDTTHCGVGDVQVLSLLALLVQKYKVLRRRR